MAVSSAVVWEIRSTGSSSNGGGFKIGASGTDYSKQDAAQYALTGCTSAGAGNVVLTASAAADMVGNIGQCIGGTNFTTGFFEVLSVSVGVSITFGTDRTGASITTGVGASGVINIGGGLATAADFTTLLNSSTPVAQPGNSVFVKSGANYDFAAAQTLRGGSNGLPVSVIGYTTTHGDGGQATFRWSANPGAAAYLMTSGAVVNWQNIIFDARSYANGRCFTDGNYNTIYNCQFKNCGVSLYSNCVIAGTSTVLIKCYSTGGVYNGFSFSAGVLAFGCVAEATGNHGFSIGNAGLSLVACIARNSVNANTDGFTFASTSNGCKIIACISDNNKRDGMNFQDNASAIVMNCILSNNGAYGIRQATNYNALTPVGSPQPLVWLADFNGFYNNGSGTVLNIPQGPNDVLVTVGTPFTNSSGGDYSLNNTTNQGALLRAKGILGAFPVLSSTGYQDIGAVQHQDAGGTTINIFPVFD